jgi:golgi phosphoprotein 3
MLLAKELLLLTINEQDGGEIFYHAWKKANAGVAGALLMDLALEKRIFCRHGKVIVLLKKRTGNEILDRILGNIIRSDSPKSIEFWVDEIQDDLGNVSERIIDQLEEEGILERVALPHKFGIKMHYPLTNPQIRRQILERIRLFSAYSANTKFIEDYRTYTLIYLLRSCELCNIVREYLQNVKVRDLVELLNREGRTTKQYVKEMLCSIRAHIAQRPAITLAA